MAAIELCRTAALGGHVETCDDCALSSVAYNSCRNRHCPKCQGATRDRDYLHGNAPRSMTLAPHEFIRRFLLQPARRLPPHPPLRLPANGIRRVRLAVISRLLAGAPPQRRRAEGGQPGHQRARFDPTVCPCCGGILRITARLRRARAWPDMS